MFSSLSRGMTKIMCDARVIPRGTNKFFFSFTFTIMAAYFMIPFFSRAYVDVYSYNKTHARVRDLRQMQVDRFTRSQETCRLYSCNRYCIYVSNSKKKIESF